ncbi:MAG: ankyrin repeat domain-containing protein, partial [Pseudomonadota bacterium]
EAGGAALAEPAATAIANRTAPIAPTVTAGPNLPALPWAMIALILWGVGSLAMLANLVVRLIGLKQLRMGAIPLDIPAEVRLSQCLPVCTHTDISSPMLIGYFKPTILVPEDFDVSQKSRPVLEHEIAHAARNDNWITLMIHFITVAFWWNLPLKILAPLYFTARETLCDTRAAIITGAPRDLAQALVDTVVRASDRRSPVLAAAVHGSGIKARVRRLMASDGDIERRPVATLALILPVMLLGATALTPNLGNAHPHDGIISWDDNDDETLYAAARRGNLDEVKAYIDAGADPSEALDGDGTPLMGAIRGGHDDVFSALMAMNVDINRPSPGDGTALIAAVRANRPDLLKILLEAGADPNLGVESDGSPLIVAAGRGNVAIVKRLLSAGADANLAVQGDGNPLIAAALRNETAIARHLLDAGADPNGFVYRDETPLINAAQQGHMEMAKLLVQAGADVSLTVETGRRDPGGPYRSPLSEAKRNGHSQLANWLVSKGATHSPPESD